MKDLSGSSATPSPDHAVAPDGPAPDGAGRPGAGPDDAGPTARGELARAMGEQFTLQGALGGPRGLVEAVLPMTVFSAWYGVTSDLRGGVVAALVPAVVLSVWRLVAREPLTQALSGVLGIALGAFLALRTGQAENFVLPSLLKNGGWLLAYAVSALVRWPLMGVVLGLGLGEGTSWRRDPRRYRAYWLATWVWAGMFAVRLAVQLPLWAAGQAAVLGFANVLLGLPLFAVTVWLTWMLVRRAPSTVPAHAKDPVPPAAPGTGRPTAG